LRILVFGGRLGIAFRTGMSCFLGVLKPGLRGISGIAGLHFAGKDLPARFRLPHLVRSNALSIVGASVAIP
jgi:hypothetical protein